MRWLFHVLREDDLGEVDREAYAPPALAREGFVHASYRDAVAESARLYFPAGAPLRALAIDPRRLDVPVVEAETPRGPMPHVHGAIPRDALRVIGVEDVAGHADAVMGTRIGLLAFEGMTLLDLVGPLDALSRIASMGFDATTTCEVVALTDRAEVASAWGLEVRAARVRPPLDAFDVLVVPGGLGARALVDDPVITAYLRSYPKNRLITSVCTGALLLGAAGRLAGRRATTHASAMTELARYGATAARERVVDEGQLVTAGGVTSGIELGLHLVRRLAGPDAAECIARQMEVRA